MCTAWLKANMFIKVLWNLAPVQAPALPLLVPACTASLAHCCLLLIVTRFMNSQGNGGGEGRENQKAKQVRKDAGLIRQVKSSTPFDAARILTHSL